MSSDPIAKCVPRTGVKRVRSALTTAVIAVAVFAAVVAGMTIIRPQTRLEAQPASAVAFESGAVAGGSLTRGIASLQRRLKAVPKDWMAWAGLGAAYVQQARVTADPTYYPKAHGALTRSLALNSTENFRALAGMSSLSAARHDFVEALSWGRRAAAINPHNAGVHAVIGDALVELGRYAAAYGEFQRMVDLRPDLSSYARVSYTWELQGNIPNATESLKLALQAASSPAD